MASRLAALLTTSLVLACGGDKSDSTGGSSTTQVDTSHSTDPTTTNPGTTGAVGSATGSSSGEVDPATTGTTTAVGTSDGTGDDTGVTTGDLPDGACRSDADCDGQFESCFAPGESNCGPCQVSRSPCAADADCPDDSLCVPFVGDCLCDVDPGQCVPPCADDCPEGQACDADKKCQFLTCGDDGVACPQHFECARDAPGDGCIRLACLVDGDCDADGICVEDACHAELGTCSRPGV